MRAIAVALLSAAVLIPMPAEADDRQGGELPAEAEQVAKKMMAEHNDALAAEKKYVQELETAFRNEQRDDRWAMDQEKRLKAAAAAAEAGIGSSIKRLECRQTRCAIDVVISKEVQGTQLVEQRYAIEDWVAGSQACEYTIVQDPAQMTMVRVYTLCRK